MQFEGGYRYTGNALCAILTLVVLLVTAWVIRWKNLALLRTLTLFLSLEDTVLLASAFTPAGRSSLRSCGVWSSEPSTLAVESLETKA